MLQRNPHPYALDVPDIPATVQPGEAVDWHQPIAGFEPVPDESSTAEAPPGPAAKTTTKRAAAPADTSKELSA